MGRDPFCDDGVGDVGVAVSEGAVGGGGIVVVVVGVGGGRGACGDEDAEFAEEGEGGFVGLGEPEVGRRGGGGGGGLVVAGEGGVAVDELDVFAAAAVGAFHDDLRVPAEGAVGRVVFAFGVREAGLGPVGVFGG